MRSAKSAMSLSADLMLAPAVIAMRMPLLAAEARGTSPFRVETTRAVTEKMSAVAEGMVAAQVIFAQAAMAFWPEVLSGRSPSLMSGATSERILRAALLPSGREVAGNHKRLSRK